MHCSEFLTRCAHYDGRYAKTNMHFVKGYMECLSDAGVEAGSYDLVISNCVVNLSPDKKAVIQEVYK